MENSSLRVFNNQEFGQVRSKTVDGEPWFLAKDICEAFGDTNHSRTVGRVDDTDKRQMDVTDTMGRTQSGTFVNESGLYAIMFTMQPQKANNGGVSDAYPIETQRRIEKLHRFKHWITAEVLPSIRRNGGYIQNQENLTPEQIVANALVVAQNIINNQNRQIETMKPKAEFFDAVADSKTAMSMDTVAKVLEIKGFGRNNLFKFLREEKVLGEWNRPYQEYVDRGWLRVIEQTYTKNGEQVVTTKTLVYQKGVDAIRKLIRERGGAR